MVYIVKTFLGSDNLDSYKHSMHRSVGECYSFRPNFTSPEDSVISRQYNLKFQIVLDWV